MTEPHLLRRARATLNHLTRLAAERARAETEVEAEFARAAETAQALFEEARGRIRDTYETSRIDAERAHFETRNGVPVACDAQSQELETEFFAARRKISEDYARGKDKAREEFQEARWTIRTVYDAGKKGLKGELKELQHALRKCETRERRLGTIQQQAIEYLNSCHQGIIHRDIAPLAPAPSAGDPFGELKEATMRAKEALATLMGLGLPRWFRDVRPVAFVALAAALAAYPAWLLSGQQLVPALLGTLCAAIILACVLALPLYFMARNELRRIYEVLSQAVADGGAAAERSRRESISVQRRIASQKVAIKERRNSDLQKAQLRAQESLASLDQSRAEESRRIEAAYPPRLGELRTRRDTILKESEDTFQTALGRAEEVYQHELTQAEQTHEEALTLARDRHEKAWNDMKELWRRGLEESQAECALLASECRALFPPWDAPWTAPLAPPPGLRFGEVPFALSDIPEGIPQDERLRQGIPESFSLPALLPFPYRASLLFQTGEGGRAEAVQSQRALMLRYLTSLPPGKARFTIIDPVGLGENFAGFMHLADYDEQLVASRIWTEPAHVEQRLSDLTAHMENVIQKYLRNQFQSIEEYNVHAGEVAEPFRVLVVANFPSNFTIEAARRLVSIAASGARCGVYTLVSVDTRQEMPHGFNLEDLAAASVNLFWEGDHFAWGDDDFGPYPLHLEAAPNDATQTRLIQTVGEAARGVKRVEVPFDFVAPSEDHYWSQSSRNGIDVPLGRAGATRLQHLRLGQGTAQHVLVAGKTGSGKSTLLHALIINLALRYSPDEVELYLIDFKKGVEFKTYATEELPHARVVAIESEREFGLSVLQRLDAELKARGDQFRAAGVQDLQNYRATPGAKTCPRVLLVVDEFQEFFVEDDRVAQEAALLLDRLVRQGRAFGIHVHLGSQTLSGAYALARSTIDQMAVRIALQCSESDAYLILSKDNSAARLLSRPGEAIYNDANGLVEGNDIFQVVWLSEERREQYLHRLRELAQARGFKPPRPMIVFEGNIPANLENNDLLSGLLEGEHWPEQGRTATAWLGEAIAIKDPTSAVFQSQGGSHLLIVGQQEEGALSTLISAFLSLAAGSASARFVVLDGTPVDSPHVGCLASVCAVLPHVIRQASWRDVSPAFEELSAELELRGRDPQVAHTPIYLLIFGLQRFRDLRRNEDDFSFGRREEKPQPSQLLTTLLKEGPPVGIHVLVWCDSLNNLNRSFDRGTLREFEMRVLFQMSQGDSSTLIDNPAAGKLGVHRALYHSEDRGQPEKFRPYGLPSATWLSHLGAQLRSRVGLVAPVTSSQQA